MQSKPNARTRKCREYNSQFTKNANPLLTVVHRCFRKGLRDWLCGPNGGFTSSAIWWACVRYSSRFFLASPLFVRFGVPFFREKKTPKYLKTEHFLFLPLASDPKCFVRIHRIVRPNIGSFKHTHTIHHVNGLAPGMFSNLIIPEKRLYSAKNFCERRENFFLSFYCTWNGRNGFCGIPMHSLIWDSFHTCHCHRHVHPSLLIFLSFGAFCKFSHCIQFQESKRLQMAYRVLNGQNPHKCTHARCMC